MRVSSPSFSDSALVLALVMTNLVEGMHAGLAQSGAGVVGVGSGKELIAWVNIAAARI
jgi:hypothetical protein